MSLINEKDIGVDELDEHPHGETVILKRIKDRDDYWDEGGLEQYDDTSETKRYCEELGRINQWLASADLKYDPLGIPWPHTAFDIRDRRLRRIFTQASSTAVVGCSVGSGNSFGSTSGGKALDRRREGCRA